MKLKIPCTSANLGVLFDKGGVALDAFFNEIYIEKAEETKISLEGLGSDKLPGDDSNLVCRAISRYYNEKGLERPDYTLHMKNGIPLSRGLGSSAACIAGGIFAADQLEGGLTSSDDLIRMAADMEGHGDNVCAAINGGLSIYDHGHITKLKTTEEAAFILYIPKEELSTHKSRAILPKQYPDSVIEKAGSLEKDMIKALGNNDYEKAGQLMEADVIHQPYRKKLIPFWDDVVNAARDAGVFGTALSGAGPTMISICRASEIQTILKILHNTIDINYRLNIIGSGICQSGLITERAGNNE